VSYTSKTAEIIKGDITHRYTDISAICWLVISLLMTVLLLSMCIALYIAVNIYIYSIMKQQSAAAHRRAD